MGRQRELGAAANGPEFDAIEYGSANSPHLAVDVRTKDGKTRTYAEGELYSTTE